MDTSSVAFSQAGTTAPENNTTPSTGEMAGREVQASTKEPLLFLDLPYDMQELILILAAKEQAYTTPHLGIKNIAQTCKYIHDIMSTDLFMVRAHGLREVKQLHNTNQLSWGGKVQPKDLSQAVVQAISNKEYRKATELIDIACRLGKAKQLTQAITHAKIDINATNRCGHTPLHWAASDGRTNVAKFLIKAGIKVNTKNSDGETPLHWAAIYNGTQTIQALIDAGADIHTKNLYGKTPLHGATFSDKTEAVRLLIDAGGNVHTKDYAGNTPLHDAAYKGNPEVLQLLINAGADLNVTNNDGDTPLDDAARKSHTEVIKILKAAELKKTLLGGQ